MRRRVIAELLDSDQSPDKDVRESLRDLDRINRLFGGVASYNRMLRRIACTTGQHELSLLDVAAGTGYVPLRSAEELSSDRISVRVSLLDRSGDHMPSKGVPTRVGDALNLPVNDASFDVVSCCLFMHHLEPNQVGQFVREALRVSRVGVMISDLVRSRLHLLLVYLGFPLLRSRLSRHDGPASVRRAYTIPEVRDLLSASGARRIDIERLYLYRMGIVLWK